MDEDREVGLSTEEIVRLLESALADDASPDAPAA